MYTATIILVDMILSKYWVEKKHTFQYGNWVNVLTGFVLFFCFS